MSDQSPAPRPFVDNTGGAPVDGFMRDEAVGPRRIAVCVGYVSQAGLAQLAD